LGYILPLPLHYHHVKIKNAPLHVYSIEKAKLHFNHQHQELISTSKREKFNYLHYFDDVNVSPHQFFKLTGKGKHINEYI
jgi:hypothetical protein